MPNLVIQASPRQKGTKHNLHHEREQGKVPGVLYGHHQHAQPIWVDEILLQDILRRGSSSAVLQVALVGGCTEPVMIKEVQYDALTRKPRHIDLQVIDMNEEVQVAIPLQLHGSPAGVKAGGVLQTGIREIEVRGLPAHLLPALSVEISDLDFGRSISASDLRLPPGLALVSNPAQMIATVVASNTRTQDVPETEVVQAPLIVAAEPNKPEVEI